MSAKLLLADRRTDRETEEIMDGRESDKHYNPWTQCFKRQYICQSASEMESGDVFVGWPCGNVWGLSHKGSGIVSAML